MNLRCDMRNIEKDKEIKTTQCPSYFLFTPVHMCVHM